MFSHIALTAIVASSLLVRADPTPTEPGPGDVFREGGQCHIAWTPDTTAAGWKTMNIELMTGSNLGMVHLTTVATVDGTSTSTTTFDWPCPQVSPHSAIYFYQFSSPGSTAKYWTTRFTIADASGGTTPPSEATQPGSNAPIPWGTGSLVNPADAKPAPPGGGGAAANTTVTATTSGSANATSTSSASAKSTASGFSTVGVASGTSSVSSSPAAATGSTSGAAGVTFSLWQTAVGLWVTGIALIDML